MPHHVHNARFLAAMVSMRAAAQYLRFLGYPVDTARKVLLATTYSCENS